MVSSLKGLWLIQRSTARWLPVLGQDLRDRLDWRVQQTTPEQRLRGEAVALFWNPAARSTAKRWTSDPLEREWHRACEQVGRNGGADGI